MQPRMGIANAGSLHTPRTLRVQVGPVPHPTAQPTNTVASSTPGSTSAVSTSTPAAPVVRAPAVPTGEPDPFATPTLPAGAPTDSTYWNNLTKLQFTARQQYAENLANESKDNADYSAALQKAIQNRAVQERQLGEAFIKGGHEASGGWAGRTQGEQVRNYTQERASAALTHEQELHAFTAAREAIKQGYGIEAAGLAAEAASRAASQGTKEAGEGEGEAGPAAPAAAGGGKGKGGGGGHGPKIGIGQARPVGRGSGNGNGGTTAPANYNPTKGAIAGRVAAGRRRNR